VTHAQADPQLHAVQYAFDAAFRRFWQAGDDDARMAELSNMLHHLYRLRCLCEDRLTGFSRTERSTAGLRAARGASWARNCDTHKLFRVASSLRPVYSDFYTAAYGAEVWLLRTSLPQAPDRGGRYLDYEAELEGRVILDTLRVGFDAMAALL